MTIKIYKPSKTAMQSGFRKTKKWIAEYKEKKSLTSNDSFLIKITNLKKKS